MPNEITHEFVPLTATEYTPLTARERQLMRRIDDQNDTICGLKQELTATERRCRMVEDDNETMRNTLQQMQVDEQKARMYDVLERYALEDVDPNTIGTVFIGFVDLRRSKEETA